MLSNIIILTSLLFQFSDNRLTLTQFCTIESEYCERTLTGNYYDNLTFNSCDNIDRTVQVDKDVWTKLNAINVKTLEEWKNDNNLDTACGYLIKFDDNNYIYLDNNPENYQLQDIQEYIIMLNNLFENLAK